MLIASISKNGLLLFLFAVVTAGILAFTYVNTKSAIATAEHRASQQALQEIIAADGQQSGIVIDTIDMPTAVLESLGFDRKDDGGHSIAIAKKDGRIIAVIVPTLTAEGYSGDIRLLVGVNREGAIEGVRVLSHRETPGLGDKIDLKRSDWILSFNQRSLSDPLPERWKVKKDGGEFDQFTGATITPRAIVKQVYHVLTVVRDYYPLLFAIATPT